MARGGSNYIPRPDGNFSAWANHYYDAVKKFYDAQGLDPDLLTPLQKALETWNARHPAHVALQAEAEGGRQAKDQARAELEREIRPVTNFVQGYPKTTDADRAEIGITVRDTSKTPSPTPTTRPLVSVDPAARLTHELRLVDEGSPTRRGKPEGVAGAEVWVKLIAPPAASQPANSPSGASEADPIGDPATFSFLTMTTRPTLRTNFRAADGGKTAVYMLRWVNTRGEKGPWSDVTTATVAA